MLSGDEYLHNGDKYPFGAHRLSLHRRLVKYLSNQKVPVGGVELKVKYGQTAYNSIRVCNTDYDWTYVGVTHE